LINSIKLIKIGLNSNADFQGCFFSSLSFFLGFKSSHRKQKQLVQKQKGLSKRKINKNKRT
jgi:hypothetical protein